MIAWSIFCDVQTIDNIYSGRRIYHYDEDPNSHAWVVVNYNDEWYGVDPTKTDNTGGLKFLLYRFELK